MFVNVPKKVFRPNAKRWWCIACQFYRLPPPPSGPLPPISLTLNKNQTKKGQGAKKRNVPRPGDVHDGAHEEVNAGGGDGKADAASRAVRTASKVIRSLAPTHGQI